MAAIKNTKIAVLGAGSIGCYLGGYLQAAGAQVTFIGRERVKWDLDMKGMCLTHYKRRAIHIPRDALNYEMNNESLGKADIVLVCVKSQDTENVANILAQHSWPETLIVSFQNGISNAEVIRRISDRKTLAAVVPFNVTLARRGEFHCGTEGDLIIQSHDDPRLKTLSKAFRKSGMGVKLPENIDPYQWGKLLVNLNNALSALSGGTLRQGLGQKSYRRVLAAMMEEGLRVCKAAGIQPKSFGKASVAKTITILRMPNALFGPIMNGILKIDENARSSMLDDLEAGKSSEIDFLQGEIVRLAQITGQSAPINTLIMDLVNQAFANHASPKMTGNEMAEMLRGLV